MDAQCLTSSNPQLKVFDIVSVCPGNQKVFNYLCKTAEIDVICFDFTHRLPFNIDKKMVSQRIVLICLSFLYSCPLYYVNAVGLGSQTRNTF